MVWNRLEIHGRLNLDGRKDDARGAVADLKMTGPAEVLSDFFGKPNGILFREG